MSPVIIRATDLLEGDEIYLAATGGWTRRLAEAAVARSAREAAALLAAARMQPDVAEAPRLAEVSLHNGRPMPVLPPRPQHAEAAGHA